MSLQLKVGPQGRVVIPAAIRQAMDIKQGSVLLAQLLDGKLVLETREQLLKQFFGRFTKARMETEGSVVDELMAERRAEVASD